MPLVNNCAAKTKKIVLRALKCEIRKVIDMKRDSDRIWFYWCVVLWLMALTCVTCTGLHDIADEIRMNRIFGK